MQATGGRETSNTDQMPNRCRRSVEHVCRRSKSSLKRRLMLPSSVVFVPIGRARDVPTKRIASTMAGAWRRRSRSWRCRPRGWSSWVSHARTAVPWSQAQPRLRQSTVPKHVQSMGSLAGGGRRLGFVPAAPLDQCRSLLSLSGGPGGSARQKQPEHNIAIVRDKASSPGNRSDKDSAAIGRHLNEPRLRLSNALCMSELRGVRSRDGERTFGKNKTPSLLMFCLSVLVKSSLLAQ